MVSNCSPLGLVLAAGLAAACGASCDAPGSLPAAGADRVEGTRVYWSEGPAWSDLVELIVDSIDVLRDSSFSSPSHIAPLEDGRYVVADRNRYHILDWVERSVATFGQSGEGPGEFGHIAGVADGGAGNVIVWDSRQSRITWLTPGDSVHRTEWIVPSFPTPRHTDRLFIRDDRVVLPWSGLPGPEFDPRVTFLVHRFGVREAFEAGSAPDYRTVRLASKVLVPAEPFGPRAIYSIGPDGRIAHTDGVEYCIHERPFTDGEARTLCREYRRTRVPRAARNPRSRMLRDVLTDQQREFLTQRLRVQRFDAYASSIHALLFDERGRLWVHLVDPERARFDPMLMGQHPELRPTLDTWDVWSAAGQWLTTVRLPSAVRPLLIDGTTMIGRIELDNGEHALARATLPARFD